MAVERGDLSCMRALIEAGAHINTINKDGRTALDIARKGGYKKSAYLLLEHGAVSKRK